MIIGITGFYSAGKTEAIKFLTSKGFIPYSLSDVIREECKKENIELSEKQYLRINSISENLHEVTASSASEDNRSIEDIKENLYLLHLKGKVMDKLIEYGTARLQASQSNTVEEKKRLEGNVS